MQNSLDPVMDTSQPLFFLPSALHLAGDTVQFSIFNITVSQDSVNKWVTALSGFWWHLNYQKKGGAPVLCHQGLAHILPGAGSTWARPLYPPAGLSVPPGRPTGQCSWLLGPEVPQMQKRHSFICWPNWPTPSGLVNTKT